MPPDPTHPAEREPGPGPRTHWLPSAPPSKAGLGPLQQEVLRCLWTSSPASVSDVRAQVNTGRAKADKLAYTTVMTVLSRLHQRGLLDRERVGRAYRYTPRFSPDEYLEHASQQEVQSLVTRYGSVALAHFASALRDADPDVLRRVAQLAEQEDA